MPVYNVEEYLDEALQSVYQQSYHNYELIAVNDGSTDQSLAILNKWKERFNENYQVISQPNKGLSAARNTGLQYATGDYILFFDSDDLLHPKILEILNQNIAGADIIRYDIPVFTHGETVDFTEINMDDIKVTNHSRDDYVISPLFRVAAWSYLIRKDLLDQSQLHFKDGLIHEDLLFTTLLMQKVQHVKYIHCGLYYYRVRPQSITTSSSNLKYKQESTDFLLAKMYQLYQEELDPTMKSFYWKRFMEAVWLFEQYHSLKEVNQLYCKYNVYPGVKRPVKLVKQGIKRVIRHTKQSIKDIIH